MIDVKKFIGRDSLSISEAMKKIGENARGTLFLVDKRERLIGCITDGDIRRYLLAETVGLPLTEILKWRNQKRKQKYYITNEIL